MIEEKNERVSSSDDFLERQSRLDTLRFMTCGSVDDGKSTLIGRMLFESHVVCSDQLDAIRQESRRQSNESDSIDFSLLVDGLAAEREQGITIDVAYRYFSTPRRRFIVADSPGHEQYTRNMITAASNADAAVILVDVKKGVTAQTKRHSILCSLFGVKSLVVAVNKMDLAAYEQTAFEAVTKECSDFLSKLQFRQVEFIPLSAKNADNVVHRSNTMTWYQGKTLFEVLEDIEPLASLAGLPLRFPVQWVSSAKMGFRGLAGLIYAGEVQSGDAVTILPSGQRAHVSKVLLHERELIQGSAGQSVIVTLHEQVDVSRGDVIVSANALCPIADSFGVTMIWLAKQAGYNGRTYRIKLASTSANAQITSLNYKLDVNSLETLPAKNICLNDIFEAEISVDRKLPYETFRSCASMGSFILIDRLSNETVAAGMINNPLRRSLDIEKPNITITRKRREQLNGHKGSLIWFTGLSGSGKSTLANALEMRWHAQGIRTYVLDGDNIRKGLNRDLAFSPSDRVENIRRVAEVAKLLVDAGIVVLAAFISPFREERDAARRLFPKGDFFEVFVDAPLHVVEARDPKGLYAKAREGVIPDFTGISSPYEAPLHPEFHAKTDRQSVDEVVEKLYKNIPLAFDSTTS